jgi:hypothetical protein
MPLSLSPAPDVLATIRAYLEQEILPGLRDDKWFTVKVAANMLATIERELRQAPEADAAERTRLAVLTGAEGTLADLNRVLTEAIRAGERRRYRRRRPAPPRSSAPHDRRRTRHQQPAMAGAVGAKRQRPRHAVTPTTGKVAASS